MENHVLTPPPGGGTATLPPREAIAAHEFFPKGATREVLLLGDLVEQEVHHVERRKKKLCFRSAGHCPICDAVPLGTEVEVTQTEFVAPAYVRPVREVEFVQRVVVFPFAAGEKVKGLCGDAARGRLFSIVRGASNRLEIKPLSGLPAGLPAALPPAFPVQPFVRARFGLKPDPRVPLLRLPPVRCEQLRPAARAAQRLTFTAEDAGGFTEEARRLLKSGSLEYQRKLAADADAEATPVRPPAAVVEPSDLVAAPAPAGPSLDTATDDQLRVEAIKRTFNLKGKPHPSQPVEIGDVLGQLPRIKLHADGTLTGPGTVPTANGRHANGHAGKGGGR